MKYSRLFLWMGLWILLSGTLRVQAQTKDSLQVIAAGKRATVLVDTSEANGSGFCIHESGVFVTNAHVVEGLTQAKVILSPGEVDQKVLSTRITHYDADRDLALLIADPPVAAQLPDRPPLTVLPLGNSNTLFETKPIAVFGFPFGANLALSEREAPAVTVTVGRITSLRKYQGELKEIQLDAAVNPGNSGGPVIDD